MLAALGALASRALDRNYIVQPGDTVRSVAAAQGIELASLLTANRLTEHSTLQPGTVLVLPVPVPAAYKVQPGDSLYRISQQFGLPVEELATANDLTPDSILQIGQVLRVPGGTGPADGSVAPKAVPRPSAAPADRLPSQVWVVEPRVHLRSEPSTESRSLRLVAYGTALTVTGQSGMWWQVKLPGNGARAYVAGWVVRRTAPGPAATPAERDRICYAFIAQSRVNVRSQPSTDSDRVAVAVQGTRVEVLADQDGWVRVRFDNGTDGWVARPLVRYPRGATAEESTYAGAALAATAKSFLGTPYVSGGESRSGADCSGLVYAVCLEHGIRLPRSSRAMWGHGTPVARDELQPGDLVFFSNTYRSGISHVGVYIGENRFVHAVRPGIAAQITSLSDEYYARRYAGAYRVTD